MNKKGEIYSYSSLSQGIVGMVLLGIFIFINITIIFKKTYSSILIGAILYILLFLILNKIILYKVVVKDNNILIKYPFNIFGKKMKIIEFNSISTLVYKYGGVNGSYPSIRYHLINGENGGFTCSKQNKEILRNHFEKYGLKLEDNYYSKTKLRKHIKH